MLHSTEECGLRNVEECKECQSEPPSCSIQSNSCEGLSVWKIQKFQSMYFASLNVYRKQEMQVHTLAIIKPLAEAIQAI